MGPRIGFYVHYHGAGHKHRTEAIARGLNHRVDVVTSVAQAAELPPWQLPPGSEVWSIACDIDDVPTAGMTRAKDVGSLHYAPLWTSNIRRRVSQYTRWIDEFRPEVVVVDVSSEISSLTRLASTPQIVMRQHGRRDDPGHQSAYAAAESLIAPFPSLMEDDITPDWVRDKTIYTGGFTRLDPGLPSGSTGDRYGDQTAHQIGGGASGTTIGPRPDVCRRLVIMKGRGGSTLTLDYLAAIARAVPATDVRVLGMALPKQSLETPLPDNLRLLGWIDDPLAELMAADVVMTSAGHNSVMEMGQLRRRFVAVAEQRPFEEQIRKVKILQDRGLAVGIEGWPDRGDGNFDAIIRQLIDHALQIDVTRWDPVFISNDAERGVAPAVAEISRIAEQSREIWSSQSVAADPTGIEDRQPVKGAVVQRVTTNQRVDDRSRSRRAFGQSSDLAEPMRSAARPVDHRWHERRPGVSSRAEISGHLQTTRCTGTLAAIGGGP